MGKQKGALEEGRCFNIKPSCRYMFLASAKPVTEDELFFRRSKAIDFPIKFSDWLEKYNVLDKGCQPDRVRL